MLPHKAHDKTTITLLTSAGVSVSTLRRWTLRARRRLHLNGTIAVTIIPPILSHRLNKQYRRRDRPTNVLSFDYAHSKLSSSHVLDGEVLLCPTVIRREARQQQETYQARLRMLLEHGLIHLLGHDHRTKVDQRRWERFEHLLS